MRNPTPKRHMGTMCDALVEGRHVSYHCSLERGHEERNWGEPHYAVESEKSVRAWQDWYREMHETPEADPARLDRTTADPVAQLTAVHHRDEANNPSCGEMLPPFVPDGSTIFCIKPTGHTGAHSDGATTWMSDGDWATQTVEDEAVQEEQVGRRCTGDPLCGAAKHYHGCFADKGNCDAPDDHTYYLPGGGEVSATDARRGRPTKTRKGDQRLPNGTGVCVQDVIIAEMEASKSVGIKRYGQTLRTFNGRKGIVDVAEELRDAFVYMTQIKTEAAATRNTLIEAVLHGWGEISNEGRIAERPEVLAAFAVDRIMGWVVGNTQANQFGNVDDIEDVLDEAWPRSGGRKAIIAAQAKAIGEFLGVPEMQEPPHVE